MLRLLRNPDAGRQVEWEAQALAAARDAGVRVPEPRGVTNVQGRPGLLMERCDGIDMLTLVGRKPWLVWSVGAASGRLHAQLHEVVAPGGILPLRERFRARITTSPLVPSAIAEAAASVLDALPEGDRLCHGDFHPGNIIRTADGLVVIDWTNVTRGDPTADFVRTDLMIRLGDVPPGAPIVIRVGAGFARGLMRQSYTRAYRRMRPIDPGLAARWEIPVAANRLVDNISEERRALLRLLEARLGSSA